MAVILNKKLYAKVKSEAKRKFKVWPSAYASSWLVKTYKKRGGKYKGSRRRSRGVGRWHREKWVDVCYWPRRVTCARSKSRKKYPYCRPSVRVSSKTPRLAQSLSKRQIKRLCSKKRRNPKKRMKSLSRKKSRKRRSKKRSKRRN